MISVLLSDQWFSTINSVLLQHVWSCRLLILVCSVLNGRAVSWILLTQRYSHSYSCPLTSPHTHTELWLSMFLCVSSNETCYLIWHFLWTKHMQSTLKGLLYFGFNGFLKTHTFSHWEKGFIHFWKRRQSSLTSNCCPAREEGPLKWLLYHHYTLTMSDESRITIQLSKCIHKLLFEN